MLFVVAIALIIVLCIIPIHYYHHFRINWRNRSARLKNRALSHPNSCRVELESQMRLLTTSHCQRKCCCHLVPVDDQEFDFFPLAFLLYLIFIALLYILFIVIEIRNYTNDVNHESTFDFLFAHSIHSFHNNSFTIMHLNESHNINAITVMDYILVYSTIVLFVWISLFSFYRYYTTYVSLQMKSMSTKVFFSKFATYSTIFCVILLLQINVYYYLFPIVILLFCIFNWFCIYSFATMLTASVKLIIQLDIEESGVIKDANKSMLNSIIFCKNVSIICCILQSINISIFVITYNVQTLGYLSILWSISGCILALNFARTRESMKYQLFKCKQSCFCCANNQKTVINTRMRRRALTVPIDKYQKMNNVTQRMPPLQRDALSQSVEQYDGVHKASSTKPTLLRTKSGPLTVGLHSEDQIEVAQEKHENTDATVIPPVSPPLTLTLVKSRSNPYAPKIESDASVIKRPKVKRRSTVSALYIPPDRMEITEMKTMQRKDIKLPLCKSIKVQPSTSVYSCTRSPTKALDLLGIESPASQSTIEQPTQVSKKQSLSKTVHVQFKEYIAMLSDEEVALEISVIPMPHVNRAKSQTQSIAGSILNVNTPHFPGYLDHVYEDIADSEAKKEDQPDDVVSPTIATHDSYMTEPRTSKVMPDINVHLRDQTIDIAEMIVSLNKLAKCGFCSSKSINSMKQLHEYLSPIPHDS